MADNEDEHVDRPATWENVVVGKAEKLLGRVTHNHKIEQEGEDALEAAHEVEEEFREEHPG